MRADTFVYIPQLVCPGPLRLSVVVITLHTEAKFLGTHIASANTYFLQEFVSIRLGACFQDLFNIWHQ